MTLEEFNSIFEGGEFTTDWLSYAMAQDWVKAFWDDREKFNNVLEIGSWEGRSARFMAWLFPNAYIECVDTFEGSADDDLPENKEVYHKFRINTVRFEDRIEAHRASSAEFLSYEASRTLEDYKQKYDLIYIDGSHKYDDIMVDSLLSWKLLRVGGYLIWDDYPWQIASRGRLTPKLAIDQFLDAYQDDYEGIWVGWQLCIKRIA